MKLYDRMMTSKFAYDLLDKKDYMFLYANPKRKANEIVEKRGTKIKNELNPKKYYEIAYFSNGVSEEKKIQEGFTAIDSNDCKNDYVSLEKKTMHGFLESIYGQTQILVVDFTLMNTRFLGSFFATLNLFKWKEVYFCYTEPGSYNKNEEDDFDLKNTTMGFDQIPGLETSSDSLTECDWVVFLGFEGSRLMRLEEEAPASRRYALPYISIPAMKTSWHNIAMKANRQFFELKINNQEKIDYVSAINPFETYNKLISLKNGNANVRLVISPIGPKPVMLGCVMYVLENAEEMLLFDNPFQEGNNTEECGCSHFYDLTQFVNAVENKRYI